MGNECTSCGNKISIFAGNKPEFGTIERAKYIKVYREGLCQKCLVKEIEKYEQEQLRKEETLNKQAIEFLDKIKISAESKPDNFEDLGIVSGYSVLGTGPIATIFSSFTDFFGMQSMSYIKKLKTAEDFAMKMLKMNAVVRGGNSIFSCKIQVNEASSGHGMLMFTATGTAVNDTSVHLDEDNESLTMITNFYKNKLGNIEV